MPESEEPAVEREPVSSPDPVSASRDVVIAVDPGRAKCGLAVVRCDGAVLHRRIVATAELTSTIQAVVQEYRPVVLLIGIGTGSRPLIKALEAAGLTIPILPVDEAHTSEEARLRFVAENPPQGWHRLLPACLRTPDCPYDDYVAVILSERYWRSRT